MGNWVKVCVLEIWIFSFCYFWVENVRGCKEDLLCLCIYWCLFVFGYKKFIFLFDLIGWDNGFWFDCYVGMCICLVLLSFGMYVFCNDVGVFVCRLVSCFVFILFVLCFVLCICRLLVF